jgi:hypothetical protein
LSERGIIQRLGGACVSFRTEKLGQRNICLG